MTGGMREEQKPTAPHPRDSGVEPQDSSQAAPSLPRARQGSATFTSQPSPSAAPWRPHVTPDPGGSQPSPSGQDEATPKQSCPLLENLWKTLRL